MPTLMETTLKFDCTRLEEQVLLNKEKDVQLDTRVTALEGKETPVYTPMDLDLNTGVVAVTYDTTDGISLTTQGTIKANTGTDQVVVDYEIPIVAGNNILIDKKADEDKIEVKLDKSQPIVLKGKNEILFKADYSEEFVLPEDYFYMAIKNYNTIRVKNSSSYADCILPEALGDNPHETHYMLSDKTVKTLFGNQSIYSQKGGGNIDLYRHNITFRNLDMQLVARTTIISSKNLKVDSLTDLKTLLGNIFEVPATGAITLTSRQVITALTETGIITADDEGINPPTTYPSGTWEDEVTTV